MALLALAEARVAGGTRRLLEGQAALRRVTAIAAAGEPPRAVFEAVTTEVSALLDGGLVALTRYEGGGTDSVVVAQTGGHVAVGARLHLTGDGIATRLWRSGRPERIDDYSVIAATMAAGLGVRAVVAVPVTVDGSLWGTLSLSSRGDPLPAGTEERLALFAAIVAAAVVSAAARESLHDLAAEQAALLRVAALVARRAGETEIFEAVATGAAGLIHDEPTTLVRYEGDRTFMVLAHRNGPAPVGTRVTVPAGDAGTLDEMMRTLRPARLDRYDLVADRTYSSRDFGVGSSVSVPIIVNGRLWGALGTLNEGRRLPAGTETRLGKFAELVASALANVEAHAELQRFAARQAALRRVAELVAAGSALGEVFDAVATEASNILGESAANLFRHDGAHYTVVATSRSSIPVGYRSQADGRVRWTGGSCRLPTLAGTDSARLTRDFDVGALVAVPIFVEGQLWGGLSTTTPGDPPPPDAEDRLTEFAKLAAAAIANAENKEKLRTSRARVVATADEVRQRLQRDVHDGAQQRLVQTVLSLKLALDAAARGEDTVGLMREALENAERATVELRDIVHGILPMALARGGLRAGIESLLTAVTIPVDVDLTTQPLERLPGEVEVTAYFVIAEALTNVVKHANATRARLTVSAGAGRLEVEISDDGAGGADPRRGSGLTGLSDRVDALDGTLRLTTTAGVGTTVRVVLPLPGAGPG
ncbi:GAF domain-containing protein [Actinoplanes sp. M2I2]|uniref:GAF domain-containing protein n=1 Tax=Actinoplanes sp. M2I2 TaxID=1734444 RepID=UPI0020202B95|nr:GAF domain-containing protein [Actinoplanes sp. M2I2]